MHGGGTCGVEDREMCVHGGGTCDSHVHGGGTCGVEDKEMCMEEVHVMWRIGKCAWRRYM